MSRLLAALLALAASASAAFGPSIISIDAEDEPDLEEPFRPPVVFTLRPGSPGQPVLGPSDDASFLADVASWQVQIYDFDDKKVSFIQGEGRPRSTRIQWDGVARDGRPLRDAFYTVRFVWRDRSGGGHASEPIKVGLLTPPGLQDFLGPQVRLAYTADGMTIRVSEQLTFDAGSVELRPGATDTLERIAEFLNQYPRHKLLVLGHADRTGTERFNVAISRRRAQAIHAFLLKHGIAEDRVAYQGLGSSRPVASNDTAAGRRENRRVEIVLLRARI